MLDPTGKPTPRPRASVLREDAAIETPRAAVLNPAVLVLETMEPAADTFIAVLVRL